MTLNIVGGPFAGKTTLFVELKKLGANVLEVDELYEVIFDAMSEEERKLLKPAWNYSHPAHKRWVDEVYTKVGTQLEDHAKTSRDAILLSHDAVQGYTWHGLIVCENEDVFATRLQEWMDQEHDKSDPYGMAYRLKAAAHWYEKNFVREVHEANTYWRVIYDSSKKSASAIAQAVLSLAKSS